MGLLTRLSVSLPLGATGTHGESGMQNRASGEEDGLNRNINITVTSRVVFWIPESDWRYFGIIDWQEVTVNKLITQDMIYEMSSPKNIFICNKNSATNSYLENKWKWAFYWQRRVPMRSRIFSTLLPPFRSWTSYLSFLCPRFLIFKMGLIIVHTSLNYHKD